MQRDPNCPHLTTVKEVINETPTVRTLIFSDDIFHNALPGQFGMVWVPGINELPMSIMVSQKEKEAAFTVRKHGQASTGLFNVPAGGQIGIRGPYGNSFELKNGKMLLVGGGTGLVPLMRLITLAKSSSDITLVIGARTREEVFFESMAEELLSGNPHKIIVTTDDGSYGQRGQVTDIIKKIVAEQEFDAVYTCGPEIMMYKTIKMACSEGLFCQASLERMMKCGVGICGSCCMGDKIVCKDGTVFEGKNLLSGVEFGRIYRNKSGIPEYYRA